VVTPVALNSEPATDIDDIVSGALPADVIITDFVAVCPTLTDPNDTVVLLTERTGL